MNQPLSAEKAVDASVTPDQLCIGLYVHIDLPWFSHPFSFSSFKIRSADQIATLRGLGVARFRIDPARSDVQPPAAAAEKHAASEVSPATAPEDAPLDPAEIERRERARQLQIRKEKQAQVEKAFLKAGSIMRNVNRSLQSNPRECLQEVGALVDQMVQAFLEEPEITLHVMGEKAGGEDVYFHGLNIAVLSMMLASDLGLSAEETRMLGLGALFHDIGLMDVPDKILKKNPEELNHSERELRKLHAEYGVRIAQKVGLPDVVQAIIWQHHELADGTGYPKGLKGDAIHPLARIVSLVNHYDNLCNPTDLTRALTPHEALSMMFSQRRAKFEARSLQLMIRSLGVYPPGSLVKLSNDKIALVQSVNPAKPLRPWVLVYDPEIPKEEALSIDLEKEPDLNIIKAIRPIQIPAAVYDYLSPRKRVTYYFDAGSGSGAKTP
ncbi:HD-GYP domain-containing protein [Uliginosibacterium sp. H3]|uniref:HD-GYP domain-containing protein n=1 Tax=Uliginosibacterium silvisoli TaxID=3114758 RepID=A0ABU6JZV8_9RHOO|nr:HD-GYP domain-containing protein [Uliginosibacterium sp. H3]